jgi:hypothetical protein
MHPLEVARPKATRSPPRPAGGRGGFGTSKAAPHPDEPAAYPRRILLAVTGLTPQILAETLYVLALDRRMWVPTGIRIITALKGAERAERTLLSGDPVGFTGCVPTTACPRPPLASKTFASSQAGRQGLSTTSSTRQDRVIAKTAGMDGECAV